MEKTADEIQRRCTRCGKTLRLITSMLEPKSGKVYYVLMCECGEKSWTAATK